MQKPDILKTLKRIEKKVRSEIDEQLTQLRSDNDTHNKQVLMAIVQNVEWLARLAVANDYASKLSADAGAPPPEEPAPKES